MFTRRNIYKNEWHVDFKDKTDALIVSHLEQKKAEVVLVLFVTRESFSQLLPVFSRRQGPEEIFNWNSCENSYLISNEWEIWTLAVLTIHIAVTFTAISL